MQIAERIFSVLTQNRSPTIGCIVKPKAKPSHPRPALCLAETMPQAPAEPKWSGRRRIVVMLGLGVLMWMLVAGVCWFLARLLA